MKRTYLFFTALLLATVTFGLSELSYKNNVFTETLELCCNNSQCIGLPCTMASSAYIKQYHPRTGEFIGCTEYSITCQQCVDLNSIGEICYDPAPNSCIDEGGSCYGWCYTPGVGWGWILQK